MVQDISVLVLPVNDNRPVFNSAVSFEVAENSIIVTDIVATDADRPLQTVKYSITGGIDSNRFSMTPEWQLSFLAAPDFEFQADASLDSIYQLQVAAHVGLG